VRATGKVKFLGLLIKMTANRNSFHVMRKENSDIVTRAGAARGSTILMNDWSLEHPSIIADSSNSLGIVSKYRWANHVLSGMGKVAPINTKQVNVFIK